MPRSTPSTFSTLKRPRRLDRISIPPALKLAPDGPRSSRSGRISASSAKPNVTSGARLTSASSSASCRPQASPTLTAAGGGAAPVKSFRLAAK